MTLGRSEAEAAAGHLQPSWLFPVLLLIGLQVLIVWRDPSLLKDRILWDADGYTRLVRVEALVESRNWYDDAAVRANVPYGTTLHWTRPFDVLLLAGASPLLPFVPVNDALYWSGALINPLLHVVSLVALMWAAGPLLRRRDVPYLGILVLALPAVHSYFGIGRVDHHGLILLLFVVILGLGVRLLVAPPTFRLSIVTGFAGALMMWVSVEALVTIAIVLAALTLSWLIRDRPRTANLAAFSSALWLGLLVGLISERAPGDLFAVEYDRLSVVHAFVLVLPVVLFLAIYLLESRDPTWSWARRRWSLVVLGIGLALAAVAVTAPRFFGGPYVDVDPGVVSVWLDNVMEVRSLIWADSPLRSAREIVFLLGHAIVAVPALVLLVRGTQRSERQGWIFVAIAVAVFVPLTLYQARWATYAEFVLVIPYAELMGVALDAIQRRFREDGHHSVLLAASRAGVVAGFACVFLLLGALLYRLEARSDLSSGKCPLTPMAAHLGADPNLVESPRRVMAFIFDGPEIVYRSPHAVVATPYQRNTAGILDTYDFFTATSGQRARKIIDDRRIELVLLCRRGNEARRYRGDGTRRTMYDKLFAGDSPAWLRPWPLPEALAADYSLFEVIR